MGLDNPECSSMLLLTATIQGDCFCLLPTEDKLGVLPFYLSRSKSMN